MPTPSLLIVPARFKTGRLYSQIPTANGDFTVTRNTAARRFNSAGLIESVASGIPRLDYFTSGGVTGCPALLVEPAGTNLFARSNELNIGFPWTQDNISFTTGSTSAFTSPDGTTNALLLADTSANTRHRISQQLTTSFVSGTTYTASIFVKKNSSSRFLLINGNTAFGAMAALNLDTLEITNIYGTGASIDNYGNGWYRFSIRGTATSTQITTVFIQMQNAASDGPYIGDGSSFYLFAAQLETGSVATSYIPTTTGTGSRSADVVSVSGAVSGSIGQTAGTIYCEFEVTNNTANRRVIAISDGGATNRILLLTNNNTYFARIMSTDVTIGALSVGYHKIAIGYQQSGVSGDIFVSVDGGAVVSGTANSFPPSLTHCFLGKSESAVQDAFYINARIRAAALYTTRLTNAELATLTTP